MARGRVEAAWGPLRAVFEDGAVAGLADGELLDRFVGRRSEAAFEAIVHRHGPMVRDVCRRVLGDPHDAEDAAQATFLVLARRAGTVRASGSLASWLYGVARRVSARVRADTARRRSIEARAVAMEGILPADPEPWAELYEEVDRLPAHYRAPIVLFHLEGLTCEQAAAQLRCPVRTVQTRLTRGRARLRERLARRGLGAPALMSAGARGPSASTAAADWAARVVGLATGGPGTVPAPVAVLAEGVIRAMTPTTLKTVAAGLIVFALGLAVGQGFPRAGATPREPEPTPIAEPKPAPPESRELKHDDGKSAGMRSIAGGGHAVRFEAPGEGWKVTSVRLYGSRYGTPKAPDEDFRVILCDADFKPIATFPLPYKTFARGNPKWVALDVKPTAVPKTFYVCVDFDPEQTKGVYVHHDDAGDGSSFVGLPGDGKPKPFAKGDWMIRATLQSP